MPGDIIKFGKARKAKTKAERENQAIANRAKFGRTKEARAKETADAELARERHEALRLRRPDAEKKSPRETAVEFARRQLVMLKSSRSKTPSGAGGEGSGETGGGTPT